MKTTILFIALLFYISLDGFTQVEVGDRAPQFSLHDASNVEWNSTDYIGKKVLIVYFYPAAMTGGCTKQACAFRDDKSKLDEEDALVVGISGDDVKNLQYFKEAHNLNFPLLSDPDGSVASKFGVQLKDGGSIIRNIGGEDMTLNRGVTTSRWTFIIDKKGNIAYKNTEVNATEDSQQTLEIIKQL